MKKNWDNDTKKIPKTEVTLTKKAKVSYFFDLHFPLTCRFAAGKNSSSTKLSKLRQSDTFFWPKTVPNLA